MLDGSAPGFRGDLGVACSRHHQRTRAGRDGMFRRGPATSSTRAWNVKCTDSDSGLTWAAVLTCLDDRR